MKKYYTKSGGYVMEQDQQKVGEFLFEKCSGLQTKQILEIVKKEKQHNPLYRYINWNNNKAGELWRLHQIRNIVNHFEIEIISEKDSIPRNIKLMYNVQEGNKNIYVNYDDLLNNDDYMQQIIEDARRELNEWTIKYNVYKNLSSVRRKVEKIIEYDFRKVKVGSRVQKRVK